VPGGITRDGGSITSKGLCWSTSTYPTISNPKTSDGSGNNNFNTISIGLMSNTTYYIRAYVTNTAETSYGNEVILKTSYGEISDIDGNIYQTRFINNQSGSNGPVDPPSFYR